jgi:uridine kinase
MLTVGIAGGTGSGKTTVVRKVKAAFSEGDVAVIPQDSYYMDNVSVSPDLRQRINFDHPRSVDFELLTGHLNLLKEGREIEMPQYSFITCLRSEETVTVMPSEVILVEGILILADKDLRDMFDIKVFVDADADDRLCRVIRRDMQERGRDIRNILERYHDTVKPSHLEFIEPTKRYADIIIPGGGENSVGIGALISQIKRYLDTGKL